MEVNYGRNPFVNQVGWFEYVNYTHNQNQWETSVAIPS